MPEGSVSPLAALYAAAPWLGWVLAAASGAVLAAVWLRRRRRPRSAGEPRGGAVALTSLDRASLAALLAQAGACYWRTDREHRYRALDAAFAEHTGLAGDRLLGRPPWAAPWQALEADAWQAYRQRLAARQPLDIVVEIVVPARETPREARRRYLELIGRPAFRHGHFDGYRGIARDVTERIELSLALAASHARYREVIDSVREVVFRTDGEGRLRMVNHAWSQLTANPPAIALGMPLLSFIHPDDRTAAQAQFDALLADRQQTLSCEFRLLTRNNGVRWVEATLRRAQAGQDAPAPAAGQPVQEAAQEVDCDGLAGTLSDITQRKIAEMSLRNINLELENRVRLRTAELEASNRELEAFSYSVSHDLRAPLRSIDGFARILEEDLGERLDPACATHLERIRAASRRMSHLIDSLIEMARVTRQPLHKENVNLSEMAMQIVDELKAESPGRSVEVAITTDLLITCDRTLMRLVLENLLRNAWKFSSERPDARIGFTAEHNGEQRVFCVWDNGAGFDMAFSDKLFRPFHRLHEDTRFPGSGIGLANVRKIIERHGGRIWAESRPDHGARFFFTIGY